MFHSLEREVDWHPGQTVWECNWLRCYRVDILARKLVMEGNLFRMRKFPQRIAAAL
jgi:hypothetical protein